MEKEQQSPMRWWEWGLLFLLLVVFVVQAGLSSMRKTAAFDEEYHVATGLMVWPMIGLVLVFGNLTQRGKGAKGRKKGAIRVLPRHS